MRPVTQSKVGADGRCLCACIASILEIPESFVPDFGNDWRNDVDRFLAPFGLYYRQVPLEVKPLGFHIVEGTSPRGGQHACVGFNGRIIHDPHPQDGTGRGLKTVERYGVLIRRFTNGSSS